MSPPTQTHRWARLKSNLRRNKAAVNSSWHEFKDFKKLHDDKYDRLSKKPYDVKNMWHLSKLKKRQLFAQKKGSFYYRRMQSDLVNDYTDIKRHSYNTFM